MTPTPSFSGPALSFLLAQQDFLTDFIDALDDEPEQAVQVFCAYLESCRFPRDRANMAEFAIGVLSEEHAELMPSVEAIRDASLEGHALAERAIDLSLDFKRQRDTFNAYQTEIILSEIADRFLAAYRTDPFTLMHLKDATKRMTQCGRDVEVIQLLEPFFEISTFNLGLEDQRFLYGVWSQAYQNTGDFRMAKIVCDIRDARLSIMEAPAYDALKAS